MGFNWKPLEDCLPPHDVEIILMCDDGSEPFALKATRVRDEARTWHWEDVDCNRIAKSRAVAWVYAH